MSIKIENIMCRHYLCSDTLNKYKNNAKFKIYENDKHTIFDIRDSIHYNAIFNDDYKLYDILIRTTSQKEHSVKKFKQLIEDFDIKKIGKINIHFINKYNKYYITDGLHRIIIMMHKNIISDSVPIDILNITYDDDSINTIKTLLSCSTGKKHYNGWNNRTTYGYHSYNIANINITGQRKPFERLNIFRKHLDFNNKVVMDFGCNVGGMLHHLKEIDIGIGIDFSKECIKAANGIKDILQYNTLYFIEKDLNVINMNEVLQMYNIKKVDIIFMLALGSWVKNWKKLYTDALDICDTIILETNNDKEGAPQIHFFESKKCKITKIIEKSSDDTTGNILRKTYIINKL